MLEMLIKPKTGEKKPWMMFFIGLLYASISILLVHWLSKGGIPFSGAEGLWVMVFAVIFTLPFMYYIIKIEEKQDETIEGVFKVWNAHKDALYAFMFLFLGFLIALTFWYILLQNPNLLNFQIETYCQINSPGNVEQCIKDYSLIENSKITGEISREVARFLSILENNIGVMMFTLLFSLLFGAGAIFILMWNASVIAAAIGIFTSNKISDIPLGVARYMIHGFPEIAAYFVTALAGGMFGVGFIRHGLRNRKFLKVVQNVILLLFISIFILIVAAWIEVYITPMLF
ncbi:MAG: stage II sporulation protein M [Nanoarchaeota archaeon]